MSSSDTLTALSGDALARLASVIEKPQNNPGARSRKSYVSACCQGPDAFLKPQPAGKTAVVMAAKDVDHGADPPSWSTKWLTCGFQ